ncbi:hypothetical protein [Paracoccus fistulariae]|uniref:Uncharacterized protein n=1 Tax=Paracoccus fistulariae TaxID=658446 RepID=A0ABY7SMI3_9RHOB|nr:hypothetical protein [Paracoccus fistulariae]MDB6182488.1 hypothetical protein [Paracoccus fistulariae]WCR07707.1 hypothetical protein JHX87_02375 [Paracoccus fistulariae]
MTSIALNIAHPDLFAGTFCVAGQWDASLVAPVAGANFWALVSEDDAKAFPGMTAIMAELEANGASVTRGTLDARAPAEDTAAIIDDGPDVKPSLALRRATVAPSSSERRLVRSN